MADVIAFKVKVLTHHIWILQVWVPSLTYDLDQSNYVLADNLRDCWLYDLFTMHINFSLTLNFLIETVTGNIVGVIFFVILHINIFLLQSNMWGIFRLLLKWKKKFTIALLRCKSTYTHLGDIGVVGIQFHSFLTEAVDRGTCPASSPTRVIAPCTHRTGGGVCTRAGHYVRG